MIRSVGAGSTGLNNQTRRKQPEVTSPFPKIGNTHTVHSTEEQVGQVKKEQQQMMVGVKPKAQLKSIFEEQNNVVKLNADGDRLEVSKHAISLAKEKLFS